jgi:capsular exopolysaccharide synthesis family protein
VEPIDYLRGFVRRWRVIVACLVVALSVGWFMTGDIDQTQAAPSGRTFAATTYLLSTATDGGSLRGTSNLNTIAALATLPTVPRRVAETMNYAGDPEELASLVDILPDIESGLLTITATTDGTPRAMVLANTFAEELIDFLGERTIQETEAVQEEMDQLDRQIEQLQGESETAISAEDKAAADSELNAAEARRAYLQAQLGQLSVQLGSPSGLEIIEPATSREIAPAAGGIQAPISRTLRLLIAAAIGLILGIALALLLERFDTKIRTKESAEESFKLPVLVEIPAIPRRRRRRGPLVTENFPRSQETNAFRLLAATLQLGRREDSVRGSDGNGAGSPKTILVTSSGPGEGKSTVVANLATTFAELGKRVVVLGCAFGDPALHRMFGIDQAPGLADALEGGRGITLQKTALDRVRVLSTGHLPSRTAGLFGSPRMQQIIEETRSLADVVLIDTAPVLASSDWTPLLREVDAALVVARAGKTDASSADRTAEILTILQAPVIGVVLNGLPRSSMRGAGFRSRYRDSYREDKGAALAGAPPMPAEGNGHSGENADEGIPHLARPSTKE